MLAIMETKEEWLAYLWRLLHMTEHQIREEIKALRSDISLQAFTQFVLLRVNELRRLREQISVTEERG